MYYTRLDHNQIKDLDDYMARRKATSVTQPSETNKFIVEYSRTYSEVFAKLLDLNKWYYKSILLFTLISSIILSKRCFVVAKVNSSCERIVKILSLILFSLSCI